MGRIERTREIARRRNRRAKLKKLRKRYDNAQTETEKVEILQKLHRVSPFATTGEST